MRHRSLPESAESAVARPRLPNSLKNPSPRAASPPQACEDRPGFPEESGYPRTMFFMTNHRLAGRSASLLMYQGNQEGP